MKWKQIELYMAAKDVDKLCAPFFIHSLIHFDGFRNCITFRMSDRESGEMERREGIKAKYARFVYCLSIPSSFIRPLDILLVFPSLPHLVVCSRLCFCYVTFNNHPTCHHSKWLTYPVCVLENVDKNSSTSKQRDREKRGKMKTKLIKLYFFSKFLVLGIKQA